jgi:DNA modification methylase
MFVRFPWLSKPYLTVSNMKLIKKNNTPNLEFAFLPINSLKPNPHNARTHSKLQIQKIRNSIQKFGFLGCVFIDIDNTIIAGHGRVEAAKLLGMTEVPTLCIAHLSPTELRAYMIADNRLAELAGWDNAILAIEFQNLLSIDHNFDVTVTGFDAPQIDLLFLKQVESDEDEPPVEINNKIPVISRLGDLWYMGGHRIYCGDALAEESYAALLEGKTADLVFTDPPYNVRVQGHVSGLGKHKHEEFAMASGEMDQNAFTQFLATVFKRMVQHTRDGSIHFCCMDWRHTGEMVAAADGIYTELKNICVWNKDNGGMGSLYRSKHEFVFVYKNGAAPHINNVELGRHGRYRTNVWDYAGQNSFKSRKSDLLSQHPTPKPVPMVADAIRDCSNPLDLVLDPFGGSGSTLIAAEITKRYARLIELEPRYIDVTIRRWQLKTGLSATLASTGQSFEQVASERLGAAGQEVAHV